MLEAIARIEQLSGKKLKWNYANQARKGGNICHISNLMKFQSDYPNCRITVGLDEILSRFHFVKVVTGTDWFG